MKLHKRGDEVQGTKPAEPEKPKSKKKTQESVIVYITILFTVAFLLILLSYFIQQRRSEDTITSLTEQHTEFSTQALQNIENLQNTNLELQQQLADAEEEIAGLEDELEKAEANYDSLKKSDQEKYDKLYKSLVAAERLVDLKDALMTGDNERIEAAMAKMEEYAEYLDGAYAQMFEDIKENPEIYKTDNGTD